MTRHTPKSSTSSFTSYQTYQDDSIATPTTHPEPRIKQTASSRSNKQPQTSDERSRRQSDSDFALVTASNTSNSNHTNDTGESLAMSQDNGQSLNCTNLALLNMLNNDTSAISDRIWRSEDLRRQSSSLAVRAGPQMSQISSDSIELLEPWTPANGCSSYETDFIAIGAWAKHDRHASTHDSRRR